MEMIPERAEQWTVGDGYISVCYILCIYLYHEQNFKLDPNNT
jgi:hypothetical protein